jgi:hypothetical protein
MCADTKLVEESHVATSEDAPCRNWLEAGVLMMCGVVDA